MSNADRIHWKIVRINMFFFPFQLNSFGNKWRRRSDTAIAIATTAVAIDVQNWCCQYEFVGLFIRKNGTTRVIVDFHSTILCLIYLLLINSINIQLHRLNYCCWWSNHRASPKTDEDDRVYSFRTISRITSLILAGLLAEQHYGSALIRMRLRQSTHFYEKRL